jgi:hypothetical protein
MANRIERGKQVELAREVVASWPRGLRRAADTRPDRSLTDNPAAVDAAIAAFRRRAGELTMLDIKQGPGEGNYDRIEQLRIEAAIEAAEAVGVDGQDTLVMEVHTSEPEES